MQTDKIQQFDVTIRRLKYEDKATGFVIAQVQTEPKFGFLSEIIKGYFPGIAIRPGVSLSVQASLGKHKTYGAFWNVLKVGLPTSKGRQQVQEALTAYLPDISPGLISKLLQQLPDTDSLWDDFQKDAASLFPNKTPDVVRLLTSWNEYAHTHKSIAQLRLAGIADRLILKVLDSLGHDAVEQIERNPYVLLTVEGVTFAAADKFACEVRGLSPNDPLRLSELTYHMYVRVLRDGGHLYYPITEMRLKMASGLEREGINISFLTEQKMRELVVFWGHQNRVIMDPLGNVYTESSYNAEQFIAKDLKIRRGTFDVARYDLDKVLTDYEARNKIELSPEQRDAVVETAKNRVFLLTGLPGTGKSTVMRTVVYLMRILNRQVTLLAPTGIAAQRLAHTTSCDTSTIHRFLGYQGNDNWSHNATNPVGAETVILDEMSMVGANTFYRLLEALPPDAQLILVGDPAQLPSVEEGNILQDLISSNQIPRVHLTQIYRQDSASTIVTSSHAIHNGLLPDLSQPKSDFAFSQHDSMEEARDRIVKIALDLYLKNQMGSSISYQVIAPKYAGILGVDEINMHIREAINPKDSSKNERQFGLLDLREGDRVICLKNDATRGVYNGEIGKVEVIDAGQKEVLVKFFGYTSQTDKTVIFAFNDASQMLKHAFAITTHRSQGQEWDVVIMALAREHGIMLQRQLLYTAVTRARKKVILIGEWQAVSKAVSTERVTTRYTRLSELLT